MHFPCAVSKQSRLHDSGRTFTAAIAAVTHNNHISSAAGFHPWPAQMDSQYSIGLDKERNNRKERALAWPSVQG